MVPAEGIEPPAFALRVRCSACWAKPALEQEAGNWTRILHLNSGSAALALLPHGWSRRRESNPRDRLGKPKFCHWTTPANMVDFVSASTTPIVTAVNQHPQPLESCLSLPRFSSTSARMPYPATAGPPTYPCFWQGWSVSSVHHEFMMKGNRTPSKPSASA